MKNTILSTCLLLSSISFAATVETNQTLVPKAGQSEALAGIKFENWNFTGSALGGDYTVKSNGYSIPLSYFYGLNDFGAIGAELNLGSSQDDADFNLPGNPTSSSTTKHSGIGDIVIRYKGNLEVGGPTLFYSVGYLTGLEKNKTENVSATEKKLSRGSAQPELQLQAAVVQPTSFAKLGFLAQWNIAQKGQADNISQAGNTTTADVTGGGGTSFIAFGEMENYYHPNLAISYERLYSTKEEVNNSTTPVVGHDVIGLEISGRMEVTTGIEIIPLLGYKTLNKKDESNVDYSKTDMFEMGLAGRFLF